MRRIEVVTNRATHEVANSWQELNKKSFLYLVSLLTRYSAGELSPIQLNALYVMHELGIKPSYKMSTQAYENLYTISDQIDFITKYNEKTSSYVLRSPSFARQYMPSIRLGGHKYRGYSVCAEGGVIATDLTALEFIDAIDASKQDDAILLLSMILYRRDRSKPYSANKAVEEMQYLQRHLRKEDHITLLAVSMQFVALASFLMRLPNYEILTASHPPEREENDISKSSASSLYELCRDGVGSVQEMEQMPVLKYLDLLANKMIDSIKSLHFAGMDSAEIANKTYLPIDIVTRTI